MNSIFYSKLSDVFKETRKDKIKFSFLLYKLARRIEYQYSKKGDIIFRIGEKGENFYLILKGNVNILKLVQTTKEMKTEEYLLLLHRLKKDKEFYSLKKTLLINREKYNIEFEQIDQIYESMIKTKLGILLQQQPNYAQIENFLTIYNKKPADYNLDSQEIKSLFNLNTNPKKNSILINNQYMDLLNTKNKTVFFKTLKKLESFSSNNGESACDKEKKNINQEEFYGNKNDDNNNNSSNNDNNDPNDLIFGLKTKQIIEKAIRKDFRFSNITNLNRTLDIIENMTHAQETSKEQLPLSEISAFEFKSIESSHQDVADLSHSAEGNLILSKQEFRKEKQLEIAKETLIQIYNIDINNTTKKVFINNFIKTQILKNNIQSGKTSEKNDSLVYKLDETKIFTLYEYEIFHSMDEGHFFGDNALETNNLRIASVIAGNEDAHLAIINKKLYYELIYEEKIKLRNTYKDFLYSSLFKDFLKKVDFDKKYFESFIYEEYSKNNVIIKEKEDMQYVYFIFEGSFLLKSRKNYYDIHGDIETFEGLSPSIKGEIGDIYSSIKRLEKSQAFHYKLHSFSEELRVKKISVHKIISKPEIFGLENFVFDLPSYSTITVNSSHASVFKINYKLLRKLLNAERDSGTQIIFDFAKVKIKNLIHRLYEIKKSFIDILKANNSNNNIIRQLFKQLNENNKDVYQMLSLSNMKNFRGETSNNKNNKMNNNTNEENKTNLFVCEKNDEKYHKEDLQKIDNLHFNSFMNKWNYNHDINNRSGREEKNSPNNSPGIKDGNSLDPNFHLKMLPENCNFLNNMDSKQSQERDFLKFMNRNNHHNNNLKNSVEKKERNYCKKYKENDKDLTEIKKVLFFVEKEANFDENTKSSPVNLIDIENINQNNNKTKQEEELGEKKIYRLNDSESTIENKQLVLNEIKDEKNTIFKNYYSRNNNYLSASKNHHTKTFYKETIDFEDFIKKRNQTKNFSCKDIPNKLNLKMKIKIKNSFNSNFTNNESISNKENNYLTNLDPDNKCYDKINHQNHSLNNNDKKDIEKINFEYNIKTLVQKYKDEKDKKDSVFITNPNIISTTSNKDHIDSLKNTIKTIDENEIESDIDLNSNKKEKLTDYNNTVNFKQNSKEKGINNYKNFNTPSNRKTENQTINQRIIDNKINQVKINNLNNLKSSKGIDLDLINQNLEFQNIQKQERNKENVDLTNENFMYKSGSKGFSIRNRNHFLNRLARVLKEKQAKGKEKEIFLNKIKPKNVDFNNLYYFKKDRVFPKNNYAPYDLGLIRPLDILKSECNEQFEKNLYNKLRFLSFDSLNSRSGCQNKAIYSPYKEASSIKPNKNENNYFTLSNSNSNSFKYKLANKHNSKSINEYKFKLEKNEFLKPNNKIKKKAFVNKRISNSKFLAEGYEPQNTKNFSNEPQVLTNKITNINVTVINLSGGTVLDVNLLEKFKNTSKYDDVRKIYDNLKRFGKKTHVSNKVNDRCAISNNANIKNRKLSIMNLIKNREMKSMVSINSKEKIEENGR